MSENHTARVGRIISGGLNAIVEAMENAAPDMVMEQVLREIDGAIDEVRAELGRVAAGKHLSGTRLKEENNRHESLVAEINTAVSEGRDDLAEAGIAEQLDIEAQIPVLERAIAEAGDKEKEPDGIEPGCAHRRSRARTSGYRYRPGRSDFRVGAVLRDGNPGSAAVYSHRS